VKHIVLLGDSVFDNAGYVGAGPDVVRQLRDALPANSTADLLARDGAVIADISNQLARVPSNTTHVVVSVGGNDALRSSAILEQRAETVGTALAVLARIQAEFWRAYGMMLEAVVSRGLPTAVCTIYDPRYSEQVRRGVAAAGLTVLNDSITRQAFARGTSLIDLRLVCSEDRDFANPIEPSTIGGAKIARVITRFAGAESDAGVLVR
jgi:hypothetical protein